MSSSLPWLKKGILALAVLLLVLAGWLYFRSRPVLPDVVRLLPDGQILFYANLQPLRQAGLLDHAPVPHAPEYAAFIQASGFDFERDADAVGISMQGTPSGPHQTMLLLEATFHPQFFSYLKQQAGQPAELDGRPLYHVSGPHGPLQILAVDDHLIAVTNASGSAALQAVLRRYGHWWQFRAAQPPPQLWQQLGAAQPRDALSWLAIDYASLASQQQITGWMNLLHGSRTVLLRVDADPVRGAELTLADDTVVAEDATRINQQLEHLLSLYIQHAQTDPAADARMTHLLQQIHFEQQGAHLRATLLVPPAEVKAIFSTPSNR